MDGTNPKVSFIPKGSLVREESFLERRRPRSAIGFLAIFAFVAVVGSYTGLYFYDISLAKEVGTKTTEIKQAQKIFSDAPQVGKAKLFRARADLAKELLASHTVISPVFAFISKNTVSSIVYSKFSFTQNGSGPLLALEGEAPTYAALAYQADVLRSNTNDLSGYSIQNVALTKFGTVTFVLNLAFAPDYLSYIKNSAGVEVQTPQVSPQVVAPVPAPAPVVATSSLNKSGATSTTSAATAATSSAPVVTHTATTSSQKQTVSQPAPVSFFSSLWSRFKFW